LGRTTLQDLLADELCRIAIALLRLGAQRRAPDAWWLASNALQNLRAVDPEDELACHRVKAELTTFLGDLRSEMARAAPSPESSRTLAACLFAFLGLRAVGRTFLEYGTGELLGPFAGRCPAR